MSEAQKLHMVRFRPNRAELLAFAHRRTTVPRSGDLGYAIHQMLAVIFGKAAPKPFHLVDDKQRFDLIGYTQQDEPALKDYAALQRASVPGWEEASAALGLDSLAVKALPQYWAAGRRYCFEVRARPVSRTSHAVERKLPKERDVFLNAIQDRDLQNDDPILRQSVYLSWLHDQIDASAAQIGSLRINAMKRTRVYRKGAANIEGPDVTFAGDLAVVGSGPFAALLARGIGRHRAFGFGMLLLSPAA